MDKIRVLQTGTENWTNLYTLPDYADWMMLDDIEDRKELKLPFDVVVWTEIPRKKDLKFLFDAIRPYTLFLPVQLSEKLTGDVKELFEAKGGQFLEEDRIQDFLSDDLRCFFTKGYGEKYEFKNLTISSQFKGSIKYYGNCGVELSGSFGEALSQIASWRNNIPIFNEQILDMWLEYEKDDSVEIALRVIQFKGGTVSDIQQIWYFTEKELDQVIQLDNRLKDGPIFVSLLARGEGKLKIIALNDRYSRKNYGYFLPGGRRHEMSSREEIFSFFDPADLKPPLCVYFAGYKTQQSFEGHMMMKMTGCPFLLITEPRVEGGSFYMGDEEYENTVASIIKECMDRLGFNGDQVILSGLSMGTFGALYYSCDIRPHAVVIGKPLISIGNVAANEQLLRPGGFATSLDVLYKITGGTEKENVEALNKRFWDKFSVADFSQTKFVAAYMYEDDYDTDAYSELLYHLGSEGVQVYGKGLHGRHNDDSDGILKWFRSQYHKVIEQDFDRKIK